jgi:hypothetical protein
VITGVVLGVVGFALLLSIVACVCCAKKKKKRPPPMNMPFYTDEKGDEGCLLAYIYVTHNYTAD